MPGSARDDTQPYRCPHQSLSPVREITPIHDDDQSHFGLTIRTFVQRDSSLRSGKDISMRCENTLDHKRQ